MNPLLRLILYILPIACAGLTATARQTHNIVEATSYSLDQSLTQKTVQIAQDKDHLIWLATWNGLVKFDGYTFRNFKSYPTDSVRLTSNRLVSIIPGPGHFLWCQTYDSRMYIFDTYDERFIDIFALHPEVEPCKEFSGKFSLPDGIMWLAARDGSLWRIDGNNYRERGSVSYFQPARPEHGEIVHGIFPDGKGGEWVLTNRGYWVHGRDGIHGQREFCNATWADGKLLLTGSDGRLAFANIETGNLHDIPLEIPIKPATPQLSLSDGRVALSTDQGIGIFDPRSKSLSMTDLPFAGSIVKFHEQINEGTGGILWALTDAGDVVRIDIPTLKGGVLAKPYTDTVETSVLPFIHQDAWGEMWINPSKGHLCHYNNSTDQLELAYIYSDMGKTTIPKFAFCMVDDRNNMWSTTPHGMEKYTFTSNHARSLENNDAECRGLMIDRRGRLWIGSKDSSVAILDSSYRHIGNLSPTGEIRKDESLKFGESIYSFMEDSKGRMWLGSRSHGLYLATPSGAGYSIQNFRHNGEDSKSLSNDAVYTIYEDSSQRVWVGTYGGGLNLVEEQPDGTLAFKHSANGGLPTFPGQKCSKVRHITCSSNGEMMLGTSGGFVTFDGNFKDPADIRFFINSCDANGDSTLSNSDVLYVMEDSRHDVYLAVLSGGVCHLKAQDLLSDSLKFGYINQRNGLPGDMVYSLRETPDGKLWIATENALCRYDTESARMEVFDNYDFNLPLHIGEVPFVVDDKGVATLGLGNSLLQVDLHNIAKSDYSPNIVFYEAKLQAKGESGKTIRIQGDQLTLEPEYRNLTVSFAALDYNHPENISYAYRLKGYNDHWIDNGHSHTASFYALPAGDYILEVKATNSEGVWSEDIHSLRLRIKPTFIETIWAKLLYLLIFVAIGLLVWYAVVYIMRLQRRIDMEQELTALKLKFFTDVSHELRTPLTLIVNPIDEVLADKSLSSSSREYMALAKSNTDRMLRLINQVLDIRKIQNNKMKVYLEHIDIEDLLEHLYRDFSGLAHQKNIKFHFSFNASEKKMYSDTDKVEKIVFNLLSNAFKYTSAGKSVSISAEYRDSRLVISVSDEGQGMDDWQKNALFSRFETFGRKRRVLSSGIGLSLTKELVEILHGTIEVESKKGKGSTFVVTLPGDYETYATDSNVELILADDNPGTQMNDITDTSFEAPATNTNDPYHSDERRNVLVVDDNDELRRMIARMLSETYTVTEAENGEKALEILASGKQPDVIISDIMMPGVDGLELLAKVRENCEWSHIPFVLLSAKASVNDRVEGLEYGADDYLTKPFSTSYLRARLKSIFGQRSRLRDLFLQELSSDSRTSETSDTRDSVPLTDYDSKFVGKLMEYIEGEAHRPDLTIDEMANAMGIGRTIFNRKVKSLLNATPVELLASVRMKLARTLLAEGKSTVAEIAYNCGFSSPQYFSRVFKSVEGCTPGEYAKRQRE